MLYLCCAVGWGAGVDAMNPFQGGRFMYMDQLEKLNQCTPLVKYGQLPKSFTSITTPLKAEEWETELRNLPDKRCVRFVLKRISEGFRIGF